MAEPKGENDPSRKPPPDPAVGQDRSPAPDPLGPPDSNRPAVPDPATPSLPEPGDSLAVPDPAALAAPGAGSLAAPDTAALSTPDPASLATTPPASLATPPGQPPPPPPKSPADDLEDSRMPFLEHLRELRVRLRNAVIALTVGFLVAFLFSQELFVILARPLVEVWHQVSSHNSSLGKPVLYFSSLVEPFWVYLSISLWGGVFVASPAIFHQLWMFVAPGLYRHERRYGVAFAATSALLFIGGAVFCYHLVLPAAYSFFLDYSTHNLAALQRGLGVNYTVADAIALQPLLGMDAYLGFVKKLLLAFGLVFELPLLILFLSLAGAVTHRGLWRFNRWFAVLAFAAAALLTPGPDVVSQILMALPMIVLYNASIVLAYMVERRRAAAAANVD